MKTWEWRRAVGQSTLAANTKLILYSLADFMNDDGGQCWPTIEQLTSYSGLSRRCVITQLQRAVSLGWIIRTSRKARGQAWRNYTYQASVPVCTETDKKLVQKVVQPVTQAGANNDMNVVHPLHITIPDTLPDTKIKKLKQKKLRAVIDRHTQNDPAFNEFWQAYPRKVSQFKTKEIWYTLTQIQGVPYEIIIRAARQFSDHLRTIGTEKSYIPHPTTWLRQRRFEDDIQHDMASGEQSNARGYRRGHAVNLAADRLFAQDDVDPRTTSQPVLQDPAPSGDLIQRFLSDGTPRGNFAPLLVSSHVTNIDDTYSRPDSD